MRMISLLLVVLLVGWLFVRDARLRPMTPGAWVALLWIVLIGTKPISFWFGSEITIEKPEDYLEGSPLDRAVFLIVILSGLFVLIRRRVNWQRIFSANRLIIFFFVFWGLSTLWSDYSFVSFKRWTKDIGNLIMALIILTETNSFEKMKAIFARFSYIALPTSIALIRYLPEYGRYYNRWSWEPFYCGVAGEKNALGCIVFLCTLFLVWDLIETRKSPSNKIDRPDLAARVALLLMAFWLLAVTNSSTSLICAILGTGMLVFLQFPSARTHFHYLWIWSMILGSIFLMVYSVPHILQNVIGMFGRDLTLTGRTDIWSQLFKAQVNPLLGEGYQSFWLGSAAKLLWQEYYFHPIQAHNGYIETYLNGGLLGLGLLLAFIAKTAASLKTELMNRSGPAMLRLTLLLMIVLYNWTEAVFDVLAPIWVILLVIALRYPGHDRVVSCNFKLEFQM